MIVVIGGGIVGLATAWRLQQRGHEVKVLEKESAPGRHQSSHNSGVLHAGLYYKPGSRKAILARRGIQQMVAFCEKHNIAHDVCGKVVVAVDETELPRLKNLYERGQQNGMQGLRMLAGDELREIEPHAAGIAAVRVPEEGIADYPAVCARLASMVNVVTNAEVTAIHRDGNGWKIITRTGEHACNFVISCAGLHSDRVAAMTGRSRNVQILPFRGEYYKLRKDREHLCRNLIYPVPNPEFPFLGVHYTRVIEGGVEAGPNAVLATSREGYKKTDFRAGDLADALAFPGLWRFLARYPKISWNEVRRSFSKELFCATLQRKT
jgi:L-2-hydroxyglutarate oxidase LhgO